jgi:hypothetical protein
MIGNTNNVIALGKKKNKRPKQDCQNQLMLHLLQGEFGSHEDVICKVNFQR